MSHPYMTPEAEELIAAAGQPGEALPPLAPSPKPKPAPKAVVKTVAKAKPKPVTKAPVQRVAPPPVAEVEADEEPPAAELVSEYPKVFYNPRVIDERFRVIGSPYSKRFVQGRFVALDANDEASVRGALRGWGVDKADRWCGEDRSQEWVCRQCSFRTFLDQAKYDHEYLLGH